ncbi:MAG: hypothetical protein ACFCUI_12560 [Bernardetiaceae bacterium]
MYPTIALVFLLILTIAAAWFAWQKYQTLKRNIAQQLHAAQEQCALAIGEKRIQERQLMDKLAYQEVQHQAAIENLQYTHTLTLRDQTEEQRNTFLKQIAQHKKARTELQQRLREATQQLQTLNQPQISLKTDQELEAAYLRLEEELQEKERLIEAWNKTADTWIPLEELQKAHKEIRQLQQTITAIKQSDHRIFVPLRELEAAQAEVLQLHQKLEAQQLTLRQHQMGWFVAPTEQTDDLTRITGIDAHTQAQLNRIGITAFAQIAHLQEADVEQLNQLLNYPPERIERQEWVEQAQRYTSTKHN